MSQEPVELVPYDSAWPARYAAEARRIGRAVGPRFEALAHVGSTAVPGLAAKPILDVQGGVATLADAESCVDALATLGYEYVPALEEATPERRYFRKTAGGDHTHHLHVVETGSNWWERHLLFRDYLRANPDVAAAYERVKRRAAREHRHDEAAYGAAKAGFVDRVEARARRAAREDDERTGD
jgi:GrpB-like predicted nucleotidyltransferase (UPF0157 family)